MGEQEDAVGGADAGDDAGAFEPAVEVIRGGVVESVHYASVAVVDADGTPAGFLGDPHRGVVLRSAMKFMQALPFFEEGLHHRMGLSSGEQAITMGSHSGQEAHVEAVLSILGKAGVDPSALMCGRHRPYHRPTSRTLGNDFNSLHNGCSGKHSMMLATCALMDWDIPTYLEVEHPLQVRIREVIAAIADLPVDRVVPVVDGCNAPTFMIPLASLARCYAVLGSCWDVTSAEGTEAGGSGGGGAGSDGADGTGDAESISAGATERALAIREAGNEDEDADHPGPKHIPAEWVPLLGHMAQLHVDHPFMIAGDDRFDTDMMLAGNRVRPSLICKVGGEAVHGTSMLGTGSGMAVKISDGEFRPLGPVIIPVLEQLGLMEGITAPATGDGEEGSGDKGEAVGEKEGAPSFQRLRHPVEKTHTGVVSGELRPCFTLHQRVRRALLMRRGFQLPF